MWGMERAGTEAWGQRVSVNNLDSTSSRMGAKTTSTLESYLNNGTLHIGDSKSSGGPGSRSLLRRVLSSPRFDYFISAVAVLNAGIIGLEQGCRLESEDCRAYEYVEAVLVLFYLLELLAVLGAYGRRALRNTWVRLDAFLVFSGILSQLVLLQHEHQLVQLGKYFQVLRLLRMARTLRLARTMRAMLKFRELCMLAQGFLNSLNMLIHTLLLGLALLYVCSCVAMELIPLSVKESSEELSEELKASVELNFRSLPMTMLTLIQFFNFDSSHGIYRPWVEAHPGTAFFFITALLVMGVVFMNLVTAVIVNSALENAMQDHEMQRAVMRSKRKALLQNLKDAFKEADENNSGELSRDELLVIYRKEKDLMHGILGNQNDVVKLFDYLDVDGNGEIGIKEFCDGIEDLVLSEAPLEIKRIERMVESIREQLRQSQKLQESLEEQSRQLQAFLHAAGSSRLETPLASCCEVAAAPLSLPAKPEAAFDSVADMDSSSSGRPTSSCCKSASSLPATDLSLSSAAQPAWAAEILESLAGLSGRLEQATEAWLAAAAPEALQQAVSAAVQEAFDAEDFEEEEEEVESSWSSGSAAAPPAPRSLRPQFCLGGPPARGRLQAL